MRRTCGTILILLLLPLAVGEQGGYAIDFGTPAQFGPDADAGGVEWVLLLFGPEDDATFHFRAEAPGSLLHHSVLRYDVDAGGSPLPSAGYHSGTPLPSESEPIERPIQLELGFPPGQWRSLYVEARNITLRLDGVDAEALVTRAGDLSGAYRPPSESGVSWLNRQWAHTVGAGAALQLGAAGQAGFGVHLQAEDLQVVEWHNARVDCRGADPCPGDARADHVPLDGTPVTSGAVAVARFEEVQASGGTFAGQGTARMGAAGGAVLDLAVRGSVRLPLAQPEAACDCPVDWNGTLHADGDIRLSGFTPQSGASDRLRAEMSGSITSARIDESYVDPSLFGGLAVGAASLGVLAVAYLIVRHFAPGLAGFLVRDAEEALGNPNRRLVHQIIVENPGATQRELHRLSGLARSTVENHVAVLVRVGHVVKEPMGNTHRHFPRRRALGRGRGGLRVVVALRDRHLRDLHDLLHRLERPFQSDIAAHAAEAMGWPPSTTAHRLARLVESGLAATALEGGRRWYRPLPWK